VVDHIRRNAGFPGNPYPSRQVLFFSMRVDERRIGSFLDECLGIACKWEKNLFFIG
jgi:hypothetical protein